MNKQTFVIILLCLAFVGYAFANKAPMDKEVKNPFTGIKKLFAGSDSGSGTVTVKAGSVKCLIPKKLCVSVQYLVKDKKVGDGAAFAVALPHKTFTARVKAGREFTVRLGDESYILRFESVSVADNSATFSLERGGEDDDES